MFNGFGDDLEKILFDISLNNTKTHFNEIYDEYNNSIRSPLVKLYDELSIVVLTIDPEINIDKRKCISSIYNDFRFNCKAPIKEYFYIKYIIFNQNKKNQLGFFFDFSLSGIKYGIQIYKLSQNLLFVLLRIISEQAKEQKKFKLYIGGSNNIKEYADELKLNYKYNGKTPSLIICKEENSLSNLYSTVILRKISEYYYDITNLYFLLKKHIQQYMGGTYFDSIS